MTPESHRLIEAFTTLTRTIPADPNLFGSPSLGISGICDGTDGVQWNTWLQWHGGKQMAYAGVNLEGKVYDGWPVARLIERELAEPTLFEAIREVALPSAVELLWYRDAWQVVARPPILEKMIGGSPRLLHTLAPAEWEAMLREAYNCLDAERGRRGRARQAVTLTTGAIREFEVSPHLQLRQAFWPRDPLSVGGWLPALDETMANLRPLHAFVARQARA